MRKLLLLLLLPLSACCMLNGSESCGCDPPLPYLSTVARGWADALQQPLILRNDSLQRTDTLQMQTLKDTDYFGGDECGTDAERIRTWWYHPVSGKYLVTVSLLERSKLQVRADTLSYSSGVTLVQADVDHKWPQAEPNDYYFRFTDSVLASGKQTVLIIQNLKPHDAASANFQRLVLAEKEGLAELTDKAGLVWKAVR